MNKKISRLVGLWYKLIGPIHHKDRDCRFQINKLWKYDGILTYELEHHGYILYHRKDIEEFETSTLAHEALIELLIAAINNEFTIEDDEGRKPEFINNCRLELAEITGESNG